MRRILTIISALILALFIAGAISFFQNNDIGKIFKRSPKPLIPTLQTLEEKNNTEKLNLSYEERMEKGDYYFERGFLTFASNEYVRAANLEPSRTAPYLKLLETHLELRNYNKALSNAELALERDPNNLETKFNMALIYLKLSDFDTAKNLLDLYPQNTNRQAELDYYSGMLSALFGNHDLARKRFKAAASASNNPSLSKKVTILLDAYTEFDATKAAEPIFLSELLARSYNKVQEYEMAIYTLKTVLKARADLRDGWILLGFAYLNLEKYQFALTAIEKAYSLDSSWSTTQYFLGVVHKELGNFDDSIIYFNLALSGDFKPKIVIQSRLAELYFDTKNFEKAAVAYEAVLKINQNDVGVYVRPVWLYLDYVKDPKKALEIAQSAAISFPESAMSYNLLGWSYIGLEDFKRAESNLKRALEIDSTLSAAHLNLGTLYEILSDETKALASYQRAYELGDGTSIGNLAASKYNELLKQTPSN